MKPPNLSRLKAVKRGGIALGLLGGLLLALLACQADTPPSDLPPQLYEGPALSFIYPAGWSLSSDAGQISLSGPEGDILLTPAADYELGLGPAPGTAAALQLFRQNFTGGMADYTPLEGLEVAGRPASGLQKTGPEGASLLLVMATEAGDILFMAATSPQSDPGPLLAILQTLGDSLRFDPPNIAGGDLLWQIGGPLGNTTLDFPPIYALSAGPGGEIYGAAGQFGLLKISPAGAYEVLYQRDFGAVRDVVALEAGGFYLLNSAGEVLQVSTEGRVLMSIPLEGPIYQIESGPNQSVYVWTANQVHLWQSGAITQTLALDLTGPGYMVADSAGALYFWTESEGLRAYSPEGQALSVPAMTALSPAPFALGPDGDWVVGLPEGILRLDAAGGELARAGQAQSSPGSPLIPGQLGGPRALHLTTEGEVVVADQNGAYSQVLSFVWMSN
jgi:hypothetical protein